MGPNNFLGRAYQALPIGITVEGANILTRNLIIFGQGAIRCHPFLYKEMQAATAADVDAFDAALCGHASLVMSNFARSLFHGITGARMLGAPQHGRRGYYYRQFGRMCLAFAVTTEMSLISLGGSLKRRESISGRLGDILSFLYQGSAVLKHHYDNGSPEDELPLLEWACRDLLYNIQTGLQDVLDNFPNRVVAHLTRLLTFPAGKPYKRPSDALGRQLAGILLSPGALRDRLTEGVYIPSAGTEPVAQLDDALVKAIAADPALRKLRAAIKAGTLQAGDPEARLEAGLAAGIVTEPEAAAVKAAMLARKAVIQVDDFPLAYFNDGEERNAWQNDTLEDGVAGRSM